MGRAYAGILSTWAFGAAVARGLLQANDPCSTLVVALVAWGLFALLGMVLGAIAAAATREAVLAQLRQEIQQRRQTAAS